MANPKPNSTSFTGFEAKCPTASVYALLYTLRVCSCTMKSFTSQASVQCKDRSLSRGKLSILLVYAQARFTRDYGCERG